MAHYRFVNNALSELQEVNRNPIDGYQDLPVLTLEEAIEKITPTISRVMDYVATAKKKCHRRSKLLTWDESAAIYLYSMPTSFFRCLNTALRAENRHTLEPWFAFLKLFITALEKLPSVNNRIWRGVSDDVSSMFADGEVHIWWSVNSCSMDLKVVEWKLGETGTVFAIDTIHGKDISTFSTFPEEQEVVLMPGTHVRAKCQSLNFQSRFFLVHLEEENLQSDSQSEPNHLFEVIRQKYLENAFIERIMNPAKTIPIQQSYINLAIVESRKQQEKEKKLGETQFSEAILGAFEDIYGVKTSIDVKTIFEKCKDHRKQVLIFGRAGIGKTTFCRYVTFQWATGAIWQQYQLIVFIRLRSLTESRYPPLGPGANYSPLDLIKKEYFHHGLAEKDERLLQEQLEKSQILWLLDGYDEIIQNVPAHLQYLFEQLRNTPHHILTSRPYLNTLSYNVQLEIIGFTDDNIKEYVKQFFDQIKHEKANAPLDGQKLLSFLKRNLRIWGIVHIPVNLELICSLWCDTDWSETTTLTMTAVYDKMTEWLCRRHLEKQNISSSQMTKEDVYEKCRKELLFLESLAFHGMESSSIILRPKLLRIAANQSDNSLSSQPHLLNIGILKPLDYKAIGTHIEADKNHYFVHLSFQEYFTAQYIIRALNSTAERKKKATDFIKNHKYNQRFELVFTFASGLLIDSNPEECINRFWDTILGEPLDLIGLRHTQLLIACIEETVCNRSFPRFNESMKSIIQWIEYFISNEHDYRYIQVKASLRRSPVLVNQSEIVNKILLLHHNKDPRIKKNAYFFISGLPILKSHLDLTPLHLAALDDNDWRVQNTACEALEEMDEKTATNEVIDRLIHILQTSVGSLAERVHKMLVKVDDNSPSNVVLNRALFALGERYSFVTNNVHDRLVKLVENITTHITIYRLVNTLQDTNDFVRCGACRACIYMSGKSNNIEVIHSLIDAVGDKNDNVRESACYALGIINERAADIEVINRLVTALQDVNETVRRSACEALGRIGEKAAENEVINSLMIAVSDEKDEVRRSACYALGKMGEKATIDEVINSLVTTLCDQNEVISRSACEALGQIGEKAPTFKVINSLVTALLNVNQTVRRSACEALGRIGEKAANIEVINSLVTALQDVDNDVKRSACETLGRIGEKVPSIEVFNGLSIALRDANQDVRYSACGALGEIGKTVASMEMNDNVTTGVVTQDYNFAHRSYEILTKLDPKVVTHEVIIRLMIVLEDISYDVRSRAYAALEKICTKGTAKSVISKLIAILREENAEVRSNAYDALRKIGENIATTEVINSLVDALKGTNHHMRATVCRMLGQIGGKAISIEMINSLMTAVVDENAEIRQSACEALGKIGEKVESIEIIGSLMSAFRDENQNVRCSAYKAVGQIGSKAATTEVISSLTTALDDKKDEVRQSACYALGEISQKSASIEVMNGLTTALRDANPDIRYTASQALAKMNYTAATEEVINSLMVAIDDESDNVRINAYHTLGEIGEEAATSELVNHLIIAVFDKNPAVKSIACEVLGKIGEKAATDKVIHSLINALEDENRDVRLNACETFEKMVDKLEIIEVINRLIRIAGSKNSGVRSTACSALYTVCERRATDEMIDCLVNALGDESIKATLYAYDALELVCTKGINDSVTGKLTTALRNENDEVRWHACRLLEMMGEKAATNEVISGLLNACLNGNSAVRYAAYSVIENILPLCSSMSCLTHDTVLNLSLCIDRFTFRFMREISPEKFVKGFLDTGILAWIPVIKVASLRQGYGITVSENTVVLYSSKEPLKLPIPNIEIVKQLKDGLIN